MKIAMFGHKRIPSREGGVELVVEALAVRMAQLGNSVTVYNRKGHHVSGEEFGEKSPKNYNCNGVKIKTVFTFQSKSLNAIVYSFFAAIKASFSRADVVHIHAEGPAAMTLIPKLAGKRVIVTIHGLDWQRSKWGGFASKFLKYGEKCAVKYADEIIVLSKSAQDYFKKTYGRSTVFIPNGTIKPEIKPAELIIEKFGVKKDDYILYLGRIVPEKGIHYLISAYNELNTDKKLVIAGGSSHTDDYMKEIKALAGENKNIIFTDFVSGTTLEELYSNAYIYCLPTDLEGMPLSLLEAMSYGCCCLTSDIPECTEVCEDKAFYFKKSDIESLKKTLLFLIENQEKVSEYKKNSADFICGKYDWDKITRKTLQLYANDGKVT